MKKIENDYNPVKELVGNKAAEKVIWSTKSLELAVDGIKKGLPLKANPFIGKNTKLLKPDLVYKRTKEEIEDYIHCMKDPVYFASKCYLMTPTGLQPCVLRDYQIEYLNHLKEHRFSIFLSCRQSGKCNSLITNQFYRFAKQKIELNPNYKYIISTYNWYEDDKYLYICLPMFEFYNIICEQTIEWKLEYLLYKKLYKSNFKFEKKILYKLISYIDNIKYEDYLSKIVKSFTLSDIAILTDTGYKPITNFYLTKPYEIYTLKTDNKKIDCADTHIVFDAKYNEVFVKNLHVGDYIQTIDGLEKIISISCSSTKVCMGDLTVDDDNHRFYSNGILSHNSTTTAIYCLWAILFKTDRSGLILSKSGPAGQDLLHKIKDMFLFLPYHLKCGVLKWNQSSISFDNNSKIETEAFSPTAGLGKTINFLILDEFAWCPPNEVDLFYNNIMPTITADTSANVCIMSTQNGFNLFYKLYQGAITKKNIYSPFKVDWYQVPMWDAKTHSWVKRDEKWKHEMIGVLGSEEAFYYQYGTQFSISDNCLVTRETMARIHESEILFKSIEDDDNLLENKLNECGIYLTLQYKKYLFFRPDFDFNKLKTSHFVICCDLAEGGGGDYTVFQLFEILNKDTFEQIGYWTSNKVDLEHSALEFWLLAVQLFNDGRTLWSIEWNTYGALFYQCIKNYNEPDYDEESSWRMNVPNQVDGLDMYNFIQYKKESIESSASMTEAKKAVKYIPGIKFTGGNKHVACSLLKMKLEKNKIKIFDIGTIAELENFEDKNGNGSYAAKTGHDDLIMTLTQIPMLEQTLKFTEFVEDIELEKTKSNILDLDDNTNIYENLNVNPLNMNYNY